MVNASTELRPPEAVSLVTPQASTLKPQKQESTIMPRAKAAKRAGGRRGDADRITSAEVYARMRRNVYPPCRKSPSNIRMADEIESDLGYEGNAKRALSAKTNLEFGLVPPNYLTPQEMAEFTYVREHVAGTCDKLRDAGRLEE